MSLPILEFTGPMGPGDADRMVRSHIFVEWLAKCTRAGYTIPSIQIQSVDFVGAGEACRPLFIKLKAEVYDQLGRRVPGICVLRGHAVAVLPIVHCEGQDYAVLVRQSRMPSAQIDCLEIPAGMCDGQEDYAQVALKELAEETGLVAQLHELEEIVPGLTWTDPSPGLMDEGVRLYLWRTVMDATALAQLGNSQWGKAEENEYVSVEVLRPSEALTRTRDAKTQIALLAWSMRVAQELQ